MSRARLDNLYTDATGFACKNGHSAYFQVAYNGYISIESYGFVLIGTLPDGYKPAVAFDMVVRDTANNICILHIDGAGNMHLQAIGMNITYLQFFVVTLSYITA